MLWLPGLDEKPFSFSGVDPLSITVQRVGPFTTALHGLAAGDRVWLRGPFGRGFALHEGSLLLVCGGCGAAPLYYLAQTARTAGREIHVVLGARSAASLFFQEQYAALGCTVHLSTDDGSAGYRGTAIDLAASLLDNGLAADAVYACGPEPMLDVAYLLAQDHSLPCQLSYEAYMRCGLGICGSCAVGDCLVCRDGPVFDAPPAAKSPCHCEQGRGG
jgi:dihydroorotate dehydrogenase electron transfer subunit